MRELLGWKGDRAAYAQGKGRRTRRGQPGNALAIVPSTKKVGAPGTALDVPLTHINASYVRSHFDAIEVRVPGAPRADEIVFILAMSTGAARARTRRRPEGRRHRASGTACAERSGIDNIDTRSSTCPRRSAS